MTTSNNNKFYTLVAITLCALHSVSADVIELAHGDQLTGTINALNKDGQQHGKMDKGQDEGISAEDCSRQMIKAIKNNKKEVLIGGKELLMVRFKKWLPFLFYKIASNIDNK